MYDYKVCEVLFHSSSLDEYTLISYKDRSGYLVRVNHGGYQTDTKKNIFKIIRRLIDD